MPLAAAGPDLPGDICALGDTGDGVLTASVLDALPSPTLLLDRDGTVLLANSAWQTAVGILDGGRSRVGVGDHYYALALEARDDAGTRDLVAALRELSDGTRTLVSADYALPHGAGERWFHLQASRVDRAGRIVVTHTDVTSRVSAQRESAWQARHDNLTGLPNRAHLHELIDTELEDPGHPPLAVLFLDVDGFKDVNDSLGHDVGDELLRQLAARLVADTRAEDTVGRLGGDEFVVLCRGCEPDGADSLARRCQRTFDEPFQLAGRSIRLGASIGIATTGPADPPGLRATDLVRDADLAMYAAKRAGRNRVRTFRPELRDAVRSKLLLAGELRDAIDRDELVLHYQPILNLVTGQAAAVEALVRWQHPERGLLPPGEFIPVAEEHDLVVPLTRWVLRAATRQAAAWDAAGLPLLVGVNVSAAHFSTGTLLRDVDDALAATGLPRERLVLELTETCVADDPAGAAAQMAELRVSGVEVCIDDFGSGFSSLSQLVTLPAGVLKIDRSLVAWGDGMAGRSAAAIAAVVGLAGAFGMRSLAEGVETAEQLRVAADLGCTLAQGFFIARPLPAGELAAWMRARSDGPASRPAATPAARLFLSARPGSTPA